MNKLNELPIYQPPTPDDELDAERERFARIEAETIASWSEEAQAKQRAIDARMIRYVD